MDKMYETRQQVENYFMNNYKTSRINDVIKDIHKKLGIEISDIKSALRYHVEKQTVIFDSEFRLVKK